MSRASSTTTTKQYLTLPPPTRRKHQPNYTTNHHHTNPLSRHQENNNNNEIPLTFVQRRERVVQHDHVEEEEFNDDEEKWRSQLRVECNFLRMERDISLKKLEKNRKIVQGKTSANAVLLEELKMMSSTSQPDQLPYRIHFNQNPRISQQQRQLQNVGGLSYRCCTNESPKLWESSLSINTRRRDTDKGSSASNVHIKNKALDMELLRKKMEGVSNGILKRVEEEYGSMLFSTSNSSVSTSKRFHEFSTTHLHQGQTLQEENKCTGRCKGVVRRIVEQVRAETEQWSQMQEMVGQVRGEMEELQASRDFWESQAYSSENQIQSLRRSVKVWKEKALRYDMKANELQVELSALREEFLKSKEEMNHVRNEEVMLIPDMHWAPLRKQLQKEKLGFSCRFMENHHENWCEFQDSVQDMNIEENKEGTQAKDFPPLSLGRQLAEEKKTLLSHLQEDWNTSEGGGKQEIVTKRRTKSFSIGGIFVTKKRSPLRDIENLSPLARQHGTTALSLHSPASSRRIESFRK